MTAASLILAIDHGTSGIKAGLFSVHGELVDFEFAPTPIHFLPGGGAEQNPDDWWAALVKATRALVARRGGKDIVAVGVSSTFSTTVAVDASGRHLMNALTWMDSRGARYVRELMGGFPSIEGYGVRNLLRWIPKTGGGPSLSGKDDIAHVLLVQREHPKVYEQTRWFLPSKDYLNLRLTGEATATHDSIMLFWVTDTRDPSNIHYDSGLIARAGIDASKLPPLRSSVDVLGPVLPAVADELGISKTARVIGGAADHQAALVGSGAVRDFEGHLYIGTSSWVQCVVPFKKTDVFHSIAALPAAIPGRYQSVNEQDVAAGALAFFVNRIAFASPDHAPEDPFAEVMRAAETAPVGSSGVLFMPWLNGERTPVDDPHLRASFFNLANSTTHGDLARSVLEGVALNTRWSLGYVEKFAGRELDPLRIIGGGARSPFWCQVFADVLRREIHQVRAPLQANARGAALLASVALGHTTFTDIPSLVPVERVFTPERSESTVYDERFELFLELYRAHRGIYRRLNRLAVTSSTVCR